MKQYCSDPSSTGFSRVTLSPLSLLSIGFDEFGLALKIVSRLPLVDLVGLDSLRLEWLRSCALVAAVGSARL